MTLINKPNFYGLKRPNHMNLKEFFKYAQNNSLNPQSPYYKGVFYEYIVQNTLQRYNMDLKHVGGANDHGIDLRGNWYYRGKQTRYQCPVIIQCRNEQKKTGTQCVREMEGVLSTESNNTLGLISCCGFTQIAQRQLLKASKAIAMCVILPRGNNGYLQQFIWNMKVNELIKGLGVQIRYIEKTDEKSGVGEGPYQELVLTIDDQIIKQGRNYEEKIS
ncbi:uncharacterized protein T551_01520 [Pneumocystis jirovecii RU7]|uniref:Uncharacterized protein n=1 Tax=Pneumocystis jirovecii (strain RU7) TaxID=1408657 RepID=A0A0W4ZRF8_PNEJ7|nr:uncharacterized protein T551_01520 [Pneumocystis jirovecii RU7]KTW30968.1 hypothetical protein T551_01520 [Pneumocystis jirovecii RU7]